MTMIPTYNVITADGAVIDPTVGGAGVWEDTGPDTANWTMTGTIAELGGYFVVRGILTVDAGGRHRDRDRDRLLDDRRRRWNDH